MANGTMDVMKAILGFTILKKALDDSKSTFTRFREAAIVSATNIKTTFQTLRNATKIIQQTRQGTLREFLKSQGIAPSQYKTQANVQKFKTTSKNYLNQPVPITEMSPVPLSPWEKIKGFLGQTTNVGQKYRALKGTDPFDPKAPLAKNILGFAGSVVKIPLKPMGMAFSTIGKIGKGVWQSMGSAVGGLGSMALIGVLTTFLSLMNAMFPFATLLQTLSEIFSVYGAIIEASFTPLIEQMFEVLLAPEVLANIQLLANAIGQFMVALIPLLPTLVQIGATFISLLIPAFNQLLPILIPIIELLISQFNPILQALIPLFTAFSPILNTMLEVVTALIPVFGAGLVSVIESLTPVLITLTPLINFLVLAFGFLVKAGIEGLVALIGGFATAVIGFVSSLLQADIAGVFKGIINAIIAVINGVIAAINVVIPDKYDIQPLEYLATGGIVTAPTIAMIGEAGPEAVVPLSGPNAPNLGGGVTINVYGNMTDEKMETLKRELWIKGVF